MITGNLTGPALPTALKEAEALQEELARRVLLTPLIRPLQSVGALDAAYADDRVYAAAVLCDYQTLRLVAERVVVVEGCAPYQPGYFWLREGPPLLRALEALGRRPDVLLVDGHGLAHPRRFGLACHIGLSTGIPTIGCAKTRLVGSYAEPGCGKGDWSPLEQEGRTVGAVLRSRGVKPLFVSPGHLVTLADALEVVLHCCTEYRVPEPLRLADQAARRAGRER